MKNSAALALILVAIIFVVTGPLITIWALNTLFALAIPSTFATWFATLWLQAALLAKISTK
jgi:hypothetical protein